MMRSTLSTSSALLISGMSGSGKTSLLATLAEWLWKTKQLRTRLYTADGGGYGDKMEALIELGVTEVWRLRTRVGAGGEGLVEETCSRASFGWWPEEITKQGDSAPRCKLLPPVRTVFTMKCATCESVLMEAQAQKLIQPTKCIKCAKIVTLASAKISQVSTPAEHMKGIGAVAFEGLSSWSNWQLMSLSDRRGRGELHGEKSNIGAFKSGEIDFDGNNRADYGFAQSAAERWILNSTSITGLAIPPIWTGLETKLEESGERAAVWGPQIAGSARTGQVPQWVGDYLGAQVVQVEGKSEFRLYLTRYVGADGVPHPYKTRVTPGFLPEYLSDGAGPPFSGFNLGKYMELREEAKKKSMEAATKEFGAIPTEAKIPERVAVAEPTVSNSVALPPARITPPAPTSSQPAQSGGPPIRRMPPPPPRRR